MEANFEGGQGPEGAVVPCMHAWMDGWMDGIHLPCLYNGKNEKQ